MGKPKSFFTTAQAAEALGVTPGRVRQMIVDAQLEAEKVGRDLLIPAGALAQAKRRKTTPGPTKKRATRSAKK